MTILRSISNPDTSAVRTLDHTTIIQSSGPASAHKAGSMNILSLQQWLSNQVSSMWDKVADATSEVDRRNEAQTALADLQRRASNNEPISAEQIDKVASELPDGPEKDMLLAMKPASAQPAELAAADKAIADAEATMKKANDAAVAAWKTSLKGGDPMTNDQTAAKAESAQAAYQHAVNAKTALLAKNTVTGSGVADAFGKAASALEKKNQMAMTELQYISSAAQQAMTLTSNILKVQSEMAEGSIRNLV